MHTLNIPHGFHSRTISLTSQLIREETDPDPDQHPTSKHWQRHFHWSWESLAARISSNSRKGILRGLLTWHLLMTPSGNLTRQPSQPSGTNTQHPIPTLTSPPFTLQVRSPLSRCQQVRSARLSALSLAPRQRGRMVYALSI